jgi:hypothetical protein
MSDSWSKLIGMLGIGGNNPASTDTSLGVPDYSGFNTSNLQGPTQNGMALSANPLGAMNPTAAGQAGIGGTGPGTSLGLNTGTGQLAMSGLSALGSLWSAYNANSLGKQQLAASTSFANANLTNQIKSYNTTLSDQEAARGKTEGLSQDQINSYVKSNSLSR